MKEINHTEGNDATLRAVLKRQGELYPVELSEEVMAEVVSRIGKRTTCSCAVSDVGTVLIDISGELPSGGYVIAVYGKLDGMRWRSACRGLHITKVTVPGVGNGIATDGDAYDIEMEVEMYKQPSSEAAIQRHNEDREAHADIRRLIPTHAVTDPSYVHTDNNYSNDDKRKLHGLENYDDTGVRQLIAETAENFGNYYTKQQAYSAIEVDALLRAVIQGQFVPVDILPSASSETLGKIYLLPRQDPAPNNVKEEWITRVDGTSFYWELMGVTTVDLSGYSSTEEMIAAIQEAASGKVDKEPGKTLSTEDFTTGEKQKLEDIDYITEQEVLEMFDEVEPPPARPNVTLLKAQAGLPLVKINHEHIYNDIFCGARYEVALESDEIQFCLTHTLYNDPQKNTVNPDDYTPQWQISFDMVDNAVIGFDGSDIVWDVWPTFTAGKHYVVVISYENGRYYGDWKGYRIPSEQEGGEG